MTITELAALMNVSEKDCAAFINCLRVWTAKGYSIEQAIDRHMAQMNRFVESACNRELRQIAVECYDDLRAAA